GVARNASGEGDGAGCRGYGGAGMLMLCPKPSGLWGQALISLRASCAGTSVEAVQTAHRARTAPGRVRARVGAQATPYATSGRGQRVRLTPSKTCVGSRAVGACGGAD